MKIHRRERERDRERLQDGETQRAVEVTNREHRDRQKLNTQT